jgi:uncharacterized protein YjiS (DUF1127 family)
MQQERQMTDIAYSSRSTSPEKATLTSILVMANTIVEIVREWRHRCRSRRELALYSYHERNDLSFAADVDAEIAKPFWRK